MLDAKGRLCGYRFGAFVEESSKETPWAGADIGRSLAEAGVKRIAEEVINAISTENVTSD